MCEKAESPTAPAQCACLMLPPAPRLDWVSPGGSIGLPGCGAPKTLRRVRAALWDSFCAVAHRNVHGLGKRHPCSLLVGF